MLIKVENPITDHNLSLFRDKDTDLYHARKCVENLSYSLANEVSNLLKTKKVNIETPFTNIVSGMINEKIEIIPILRAGLAMLNPFMEYFPNAHIGLIACKRNHDLSISMPYEKISRYLGESTVIILDPMLATGSTVSSVIDLVEKRGANKIIVVSILSVNRGINSVLSKGDYTIVTVSNSDSLNDELYIYPGVGDSGDRLFGCI